MNYEMFAYKCETILNESGYRLDVEDKYEKLCKSISIYLIDAVYSIGVNYQGVINVVNNYIEYNKLNFKRESCGGFDHTIDDLILIIEKIGGPENFAKNVLKNRQRTSTKNGILKSEAIYIIAKILKNYGVNNKDDLDKIRFSSEGKLLEEDILKVKGQKSGVMLKYFYMLCGNPNLCKPDRQLHRFVTEIIPEAKLDDLQEIMEQTVKILKPKYPKLNVRLLDGQIWAYQRLK